MLMYCRPVLPSGYHIPPSNYNNITRVSSSCSINLFSFFAVRITHHHTSPSFFQTQGGCGNSQATPCLANASASAMVVSTMIMSTRFFLLTTFLFTSTSQIQAFSPSQSCTQQFQSNTFEFFRGISPLLASASDDDREDEVTNNIGPEKSRMKDYIVQYLGKNKETEDNEIDDEDDGFCSADITTSTHLVAIPMDSCHELLIELESVQRAILYHCPILLDACVPPAMTRLPLLYVQAKNKNSERVTNKLAEIVQKLTRKHMLEGSQEGGGIDEDDPMVEEGVNADGERPLILTFQTLEIDGSNNNLLNTVGLANDEGTNKLRALVCDLKKVVEENGWKTAFPLDPHESAKESEGGFRPRVPFMELPKSFDDNLNKFKDEGTEISDEDVEFLTSDQGGNGISPIFWCQWWDDVFGRNIRMREIGIYPRSQQLDAGNEASYSMFYLPYETIPLPDGNAVMLQTESKFQKYQDMRLEEEQQRMNGEQEGEGAPSKPDDEPDILMKRTRERLENIYINSATDGLLDDIVEQEAPELQDRQSVPKEEITDTIKEDDDEDLNLDLNKPTASPGDFMDDWMKQRIESVKKGVSKDNTEEMVEDAAKTREKTVEDAVKNAVESLESVKSRKPVKKEVPPIEENPVFKAYKDGTLVPKEQRPKKKKELGPYPGRDHFVGIWRVVTSPTGFPSEESNDEASENLILRVDGTTAGGPILDPETRQKAAGGTWKMIVEENGDVRLRIRCVIPPKKERILVMEGIVNRMSMNSDFPMKSKAFGIPHLEAMAKEAYKGMEDLMHSGGDVSTNVRDCAWIWRPLTLLMLLYYARFLWKMLSPKRTGTK